MQSAPEKFTIRERRSQVNKAEMAAARYSTDVLQETYEPMEREMERRSGNFGEFWLFMSDFNDCLHAWRMDLSERDPNRYELFMFARAYKEKFVEKVKEEIKRFKNVKVNFGLLVKFSEETKEEARTREMKHYFGGGKEKPTFIFNKHNEDKIGEAFDGFIEAAKGEIEHWSEIGSEWQFEYAEIAYVTVARYEPIKGGTYLPTPPKLASKKAIINVKNRDNECLKWALRAALFPPKNGKDPQRPSKYPVKDGINYEGIDFPTPVKQIDKLEKQNRDLAINVFGVEEGRVIVHRISERKVGNDVKEVNLMLIESGMNQHYCCVKRVSALLFESAKNNKIFYCMMCLTRFTRANTLEEHKKHCKGMSKRPIRIEMPEEGKNILNFKNHIKQMKMPFVIYADFESLIIPIKGCERGPEEKQKTKQRGPIGTWLAAIHTLL